MSEKHLVELTNRWEGMAYAYEECLIPDILISNVHLITENSSASSNTLDVIDNSTS